MYKTDNIDILEEEFVLKAYTEPRKNFREQLLEKYRGKLRINSGLNRALISFQANKKEPLYRWFKYKEGFSTNFVEYVLGLYGKPNQGQIILDPFSGIGTTITTAVKNGFDAIGIELLSPGILATKARIISVQIDQGLLKSVYNNLSQINFSDSSIEEKYFFKHLTITDGAFSRETELGIANVNKYIDQQINDPNLETLIKFAVNSILEDVSFTRKDGQYLRWDYRSSRKLRSKFNKGAIHPFRECLLNKLEEILSDLPVGKRIPINNKFQLINGSCLYELCNISDASVDLVITSPPYCNRYDYTRTYALELAYNGEDNDSIKRLRQTLLSATVENKSKFRELSKFYTSIGKEFAFEQLVKNFRDFEALNETLGGLHFYRNELNNKNIPGMVANYFFEMNFVIAELYRVLKPNGKIVMVNDNVRYNGDEIQVDLLLSELGANIGLNTDVIWILEKGKGNSSQQMGMHGRQELRKCVYVWSK